MVTEVLNTGTPDYIEQDTPGVLSETATTVTFTAMAENTDVNLSKHFSAGHFGNTAYAEGEMKLVSGTGTTASQYKMAYMTFASGLVPYTDEVGLMALFDSANTAVYYYVVANGAITYVGSLTKNVAYWYCVGFYSAVGQYGTVFLQMYSNTGRTTLLATGYVALAAAPSAARDYYIPVHSNNEGYTHTVTGSNGNITLTPAVADGITLTAGVITGAHIGHVANCCYATGLLTNETSYDAIDYGAGAVAGDYNVSGILQVSAISGGAGVQLGNVLALTNVPGHAGSADSAHSIDIVWVSSTTYQLKLQERETGFYQSTASSTLTAGVLYKVVIDRNTSGGTVPGTLSLLVYTYPNLVQVGTTKTLTLHSAGTPTIASYRYLLPLRSNNAGSGYSCSFSIGGIATTGITVANNASYTSSGGFVAGGSATVSRGAGRFPTGGFVVGGAFVNSRTTSYIATSGGFVVGGHSIGVANGATQAEWPMTGGLVVGGTSASTKTGHKTGAGGVVLGGTSPYSFTLGASVQEIVFELYDSTGTPITGATTVTCMIRTTPGAQIYDWGTNSFKSSGWATIAATMAEVDVSSVPLADQYLLKGKYKKEIGVSTFPNGRYQVFINYAAATSQHGSVEFLVDDGQIVDEYTAGKIHLVELATDTLEASILRVSAAITNKHVLNPADGTVKVYDDAGALLYSGLAYSDAAGTVLYDGTAAVHHTTRLT